ncbi:MAG: AMP-binding protein [Solirubrobacterales bacterium]
MSLPADPPPVERLLGRGRGTLGELFLARAERSAERPFLRFGERTWTYEEGMWEAQRFAGWVLAQAPGGDASGMRVASFLPNRPAAMWAWLGTLLAGAVYVPLNRSHRGALLEDMVERSGARILVADRDGTDVLSRLSLTEIDTLLVVEGAAEIEFGGRLAAWEQVAASEPRTRPATDPRALAEVMYTSGTTGRSKAVLLPHNYLLRGSGWVAWSLSLREDDVVHGWLPLFHIGGQLDMVLCFIAAGGAIALHPTFSQSRFWSEVEACGATHFIGFSNVLEIIWAMESTPTDRETTLRGGIAGGIPPNLHRGFEERFDLRLYDVYGMTESEPLAFPHPGTLPPVGAAGQPNPDFELAILGESGERLPADSLGEIVARPLVPDVTFAGYEGDVEAYAEATAGLWIHTGDLGRIDEQGNAYFVDRIKHAIRRRGENISTFELERVLTAHPQVADCSAVGVPSPLGEEDVKVMVVPAPDAALDPAALREWCEKEMASFMVPRYVEVVESLPRGPTGKVLKEELVGVSESVFDAEAERFRDNADTGRVR